MSFFGSVKWFNDAKGFGFIEPEGGGKDVFVHHSCIQMDGFRTLKQGERVRYVLVNGEKGPAAHEICPVDANGAPIAKAESEASSEGTSAR